MTPAIAPSFPSIFSLFQGVFAPSPAVETPSTASVGDSLALSTVQTLAPGAKDADYLHADPGAGRRGDVRQLQLDLQKLGYFRAHATGGYFAQTREAVRRFQQDHGLKANGTADAQTRRTLASVAADATPVPDRVAPVQAAPVQRTTGRIQGLGLVKDGLRVPNRGQGKGTVFWNGHIAYKGSFDRENTQNRGRGAWGDQNRPTDYFVALPVAGDRWHNQKILITNPRTGKQVVALVQDKGPGRRTGAAIDLSPVVMEGLGVNFRQGEAHVRFEFAPDDAPVGPV